MPAETPDTEVADLPRPLWNRIADALSFRSSKKGKIKPARVLEPASAGPDPQSLPEKTPDTESIGQWQVRAMSSTGSLFGWDVDTLGIALRSHVDGNFRESGMLMDDVTANPIIRHCLEVRQEAFRTLPRIVTPSREHDAVATRCADFWREVMPDIIPDSTLDDWHKNLEFMGFSPSGMDWEERTDGRDRWWLPRIRPWHATHTYMQYLPDFQPVSATQVDGRVFVALTRTKGPIIIEPGMGRWVFFQKGTLNPHMNGLIRTLATPYLGDELTLADNLALQERFGQGVYKLHHPVEWQGKNIDRSIRSIRESGHGGVISCPESSDGKRKIDVNLLEADATGYQMFDLTERRLLRRFLISLLGQDMTTVGQTGGFAQASIHNQVLWHKRERDAASIGDARLSIMTDDQGWTHKRWVPHNGTIRSHIVRWIAYFNFGSFEAAPYTWWDATPPEDRVEKEKIQLEAALKRSKALQAFATSLERINANIGKTGVKLTPDDFEYLAEQCGFRLHRPTVAQESFSGSSLLPL